MKTTTLMMFGCLLTQTLIAGEDLKAQKDGQGLKIEIHFQDYAGVPDWLLKKASDVAAHAYQSADITINWLDCTAVLEGRPAPADCNGEVSATSLFVQLVPEKMARAVPVRNSVFGYAAVGRPDQLSNRAILFWDRIEDHCEAFAVNSVALLGAMLAHEIGHLLLGPDSHGSTGMMRCPWDPQDLANAARGRLSFSPTELELLRDGVGRRLLAVRRR